MEAAFFLLDALAMTLLVYFSFKNDKLAEGEQQVGLFRTRAQRREGQEDRAFDDRPKRDALGRIVGRS